ncbi:MAG TPA: SDR family oxidoreductase [Arenimonas sp.]|nr:SDR family oxidoreductase [Arenimonas sp.]HOZ04205.1 SDR family oxidoreductase [Arenimonas sp.]HPO24049.1 SDR family oxidoreductase [Arenimonas sp.]HPW31313.1 SDR family oxidoreductase [Arenimonas sp.]
MQQHPLQGKTALVCGASEGIGRASAIGLAEQGANIILLARRGKVLDELRLALPLVCDGQQHHYMMADVSDSEGLKHKLDEMLKAFKIDILINNTAGPAGGAASTATPEQYLAVFQQHLIANQILVQAVLPNMRYTQWGRIVNIISTSVKEPIANLGVSNTIRGAVASWSKTLASELGPFGITVNNVLPGYTRTQRLEQILHERSAATNKASEEIANAMLSTVPAGRFAEASEIAAAVVFLASPQAGYVNGINLPVDGGRTRSL